MARVARRAGASSFAAFAFGQSSQANGAPLLVFCHSQMKSRVQAGLSLGRKGLPANDAGCRQCGMMSRHVVQERFLGRQTGAASRASVSGHDLLQSGVRRRYVVSLVRQTMYKFVQRTNIYYDLCSTLQCVSLCSARTAADGSTSSQMRHLCLAAAAPECALVCASNSARLRVRSPQ